MDKYKEKKTIKKWFSYINFYDLSGEAKISIQKFNAYRKKLTFDCALKLFLFVTRLKKNTTINIKEEYDIPKESENIRDQLVTLGIKDDSQVFRLISITRTGKSDLLLITNLKGGAEYMAEDIGNIYQSCWQIEFFFRHIKQHMMIKSYFSKSEVGVHNQIIMAMIVYLFTLLLKIELNTDKTIFQDLRIFRELKYESFRYSATFFNPG